jgi:hypothetical protein
MVDTVFSVPGGTSLQPQDFYVQTYVLIPNANLTPRAPVWAPRFEPEPNPRRSWTWNYNLDLIGKDRLPTGKQVYDLSPNQPIPPLVQTAFPNLVILQPTVVTFIIRQSDWPLPQAQQQPAQAWAWSYNLNLIGQDRLPTGEQVYDRPVLSSVPAAPWYYQNLLAATLAPPPPAPFAQFDWPVPRAPYRLDYFFFSSFIGPVTSPLNQNLDLSLPIQPPPQPQTWIQSVNLALTTTVAAQLPFNQNDWPIPRAPGQAAQSWTWNYNLNLIGKDQLPVGENVTDLPPRDFARLFQTWISSVNLALTTAPPNLYAQARQQDWPVPRGVEPDYRRSWEWSYNKNLIGQDQLPFRQSDWPNPIRVVERAQTWIDQTKIALSAAIKPFAQMDWPLPRAPQQPAQSWVSSYLLSLIGQDQLPNRQQDWPLSSAHALSQIPLRIMVAGKPFFLAPIVPLPPGVQFFDRPQLRQGTAADLYTIAYSPLTEPFTPPPVSGVMPLRTLVGTGV